MPVGRFIAGVAALVYHPPSKTYLLLRRAATKDVGAGSWECVTGRVDQGESFEAALHREVFEEIGTSAQVEWLVGTTHFFRGANRPENELLGVLYSCSIDDRKKVVMGDEHDKLLWLGAGEIRSFLDEGHWIHWLVARAELLRSLGSAKERAAFLDAGFEAGGSAPPPRS
jgi:8-oxo-dGTP diphosphatase